MPLHSSTGGAFRGLVLGTGSSTGHAVLLERKQGRDRREGARGWLREPRRLVRPCDLTLLLFLVPQGPQKKHLEKEKPETSGDL